MAPESPTSFPAAYARYLPAVRAKCRRLLGTTHDAEEVAHESFVRLWRSEPDLVAAEPRVVMAWLYRTSTRLAMDALRKRRHQGLPRIPAQVGAHADTEGEPQVPCGHSLEDALAAKALVFALIQMVSEQELEAVVLCRVDGVSQSDAADILNVSERTVRRLLERFDAQAAQWRKELVS